MRLLYSSLLAGATLLGVAAFASQAAGKDTSLHQMTIALPGGSTEVIQYTGDVAPRVTVSSGPLDLAWLAPIAFGALPSFAAFDRWAADLDRQMEAQMQALWRQAEAMQRQAGSDLKQAGFSGLSPGSTVYSMLSQSVGGNVCTRVTEITTPAAGGKPKMVSRTSGDCQAGPSGALHEAPAVPQTRAIPVRALMSPADAPRSAL